MSIKLETYMLIYKCRYCGIKFNYNTYDHNFYANIYCPKCNTIMTNKEIINEQYSKIDTYKNNSIAKGDYFGYNKKK